ncbi:MAG: hypothetical protein GX200_02355 [Firmicutes bacterium]|nr:hypothetical protein [Bacillota bacterium]
MDFERWFRERTSGFEKMLVRGAVLLLLLLLFAQVLLARPSFRRILSLADRLEGEPVATGDEEASTSVVTRPPVTETGYLELRVVSGAPAEDLKILVNGEAVATFAGKDTVRIDVHDGDAVELDGGMPEKEVVVEVTEVSVGIVSPAAGKRVTYFGRPETISFISMEIAEAKGLPNNQE